MTADRRVGRQRSSGTGRRGLVVLGAALTALSLGVAPASAESFLDPANPCTRPAPDAQFSDRGQIAQIHLENVDCAAAEGIVLGRNGAYQPLQDMPRDQMASLIKRTLVAGGYTLPARRGGSQFTDVPANDVHAEAIDQLAQVGIVQGKGDGRYDPKSPVRRDQMASFMVRAAEFAYGDPGSPDDLENSVGNEFDPYTFPFVDVLPTNPHRNAIAAADDLIGVTQGRTATMYDPAAPVRRDQMATFAIRLLDVTALPDSTLD